ncbi:MAG: D-alanyl-lipoteichoic acid biosynthesis protein DltD [Oscillospiraceae bacterium]
MLQTGRNKRIKGQCFFAETFRNDTGMLVMGSSELGSPVPENPKNLLPNQYYTKNVSYTGHAYVQNALQAMLLGANSDTVDGSDVVIVESIQWFMGGRCNGFSFQLLGTVIL